mmetsp:Transcript_43554/g.104421  ORF Transcript_43554/g.104421 Transcript_43554/m.104421 type:complete len:463 (-) Transcript_43554:353-1741(-)
MHQRAAFGFKMQRARILREPFLLNLGQAVQVRVHVIHRPTIGDGITCPFRDYDSEHERNHVCQSTRQLEEHDGQGQGEPGDSCQHRPGPDHGVDPGLHGALRAGQARVLQHGAHRAANTPTHVERRHEKACRCEGPECYSSLQEAEHGSTEEELQEVAQLRPIARQAEPDWVASSMLSGRTRGSALGALGEERLDRVVLEHAREHVGVVGHARQHREEDDLQHPRVGERRSAQRPAQAAVGGRRQAPAEPALGLRAEPPAVHRLVGAHKSATEEAADNTQEAEWHRLPSSPRLLVVYLKQCQSLSTGEVDPLQRQSSNHRRAEGPQHGRIPQSSGHGRSELFHCEQNTSQRCTKRSRNTCGRAHADEVGLGDGAAELAQARDGRGEQDAPAGTYVDHRALFPHSKSRTNTQRQCCHLCSKGACLEGMRKIKASHACLHFGNAAAFGSRIAPSDKSSKEGQQC